ncbi:hypothetical protein A3Q56_02483 [Intoshia linei]|uniref:Microtubule-associated protein n=1 Tax=Intoshia linei TaxID=1819745 RepID=A0A177B8J1_9BILA|nr:hypothetical protein A3Q56_02483 [Intoshia linei]
MSKNINEKLVWNIKSRIGSLDNFNHKPGGGNKKINVTSKIGSLDRIKCLFENKNKKKDEKLKL